MKPTERDRAEMKSMRKTRCGQGEPILTKLKVICDRDALILQFMKNFLDQNQRVSDRLGKLSFVDFSHFEELTQDKLRRSFTFPGSMKVFLENLENSKLIFQKYADRTVMAHRSVLIQTFEQMFQNNKSTWKKHYDQISSVKSAMKDSKRFFLAQFKNPAKTKPADQAKAVEQINQCHRNYCESYQTLFSDVKLIFQGRATELHDFVFQYIELFRFYFAQFQEAHLTLIPMPQFHNEMSRFFFQDNVLLKTSCVRDVFKPIEITFEDSSMKIVFPTTPVDRPPSYLFFATAITDFEGKSEDELTVSKGDLLLVHENSNFSWVSCSKLGSGDRRFLPRESFSLDKRQTVITTVTSLPTEGFLGFCQGEILLVVENVSPKILRCLNWKGKEGQVLGSNVIYDF